MDDSESQAVPSPSMEASPEFEAPEATDELTRDEQETPNVAENTNIFDVQQASPSPQDAMAFMKIRLKESADLLLYENNSYTVLAGTDEATAVLAENERYDDLTIGKGQQRKVREFETQTAEPLRKTRAINTDRIDEKAVGTYVSNYDMFDTYAQLERTVQCIDIGRADEDDNVGHETLNVTTYTRDGDVNDLNRQLATNHSFRLSSMILERILAGNVYRESQRRFRNMDMPDPLDPVVQYLYRVKLLWTYRSNEINGSAVTCMSWCPSNADILAIGYGVFNYVLPERRRTGYVCLWNMKNPVNPERFYRFSVPVTSVAFSKRNTQLLAIGFYDGSVQLIDVTSLNARDARVAASERKTSPPTEPVWQIRWMKYDEGEELLTVAQDGYVMKYSHRGGAQLIARHQMRVQLIEGSVEGISTPPAERTNQANRYSQALMLQMHPTDASMYFVGTNEGCLHKCSIYYPHQHMQVLQAHKYGVFCMEFSPWSPKIFLTCGTDWTIRIWIEDIVEPIVELCHGFEPIHCAAWCPTNSTILISSTRSQLSIWDLKTNCLRPASTHSIHRNASNYHSDGPQPRQIADADISVCQFTNCGRSIVLGDEDGCAYVYALEDMPFPPHFQYKALEQVILKCLATRTQLERQVKRMGYLGYSVQSPPTSINGKDKL